MAVNLGINIQRSPNRINQQLREAGVIGKYPKLLLDFADNYYLANGGSKTLANAVTHARAGNATMTDGYGPELVTNGSFANDISEWTADDATISWDSGSLKTTVTGSTTGSAYQAISVEAGKAYVITGFIKVLSSSETSNITVRTGTDAGAGFLYQAGFQAGVGNEQVNGVYESDQTRTVYIHLRTFEGDNTTTLFDNVSVREMPVIKWAPHNLLTYSEDFSNSAWSKFQTSLTTGIDDPAGGSTAFTLTADGPTSNNNILDSYSSATVGVSYTSAIWVRRRTGTGYVAIYNPDGGGLTEITNDLTSEWQLFTKKQPATATNVYAGVRMNVIGDEVDIWGAHVFRSDLGGMVDNPERGDSYVPTAPNPIGETLITNGTFDSDLSGYTLGNSGTGFGWIWQDGKAIIDNAGTYRNLQQNILETGKSYVVTFDKTGSGGSLLVYYNSGLSASQSTGASEGSFTFYLNAVNSTALVFSSSSLGVTVDNIVVRENAVNPSVARYLPRIGHHVYNGSAWVNEGVLAESESRTNLVEYSDFSVGFSGARVTKTDNQAVSPDGNENAAELVETTDAGTHFVIDDVAVTASVAQTLSVYVKQGSGSRSAILRTNNTGSTHYAVFDFSSEAITETGADTRNATSQNVGNGWYRIAFTYTQSATTSSGFLVGFSNSATPSSSLPSYTGDGTSSLYVYGAQFEQAETPSSLIPTSGSSVTRAAETFTIPSANLPWPTPQYIGPELVTNGDFSTDSDWTKGTGWTISGGVLSASSADSVTTQSNVVTLNKIYEVTFTLSNVTAGRVRFFTGGGSSPTAWYDADGTYSEILMYTSGDDKFYIVGNSGFTGSIDNISVREINPLSVSIGMEGRATYANQNAYNTVSFYKWREDSDNFIRAQITTNSTYEGRIIVNTQVNSVADQVDSFGVDVFEPDVLVPFDIASRHGSTFINAAQAGIAFTENTNPTALVDLSNTDLSLADVYMGTVSEFRVWDRDITDAGLVEATNPSLEPSLSLTFEGVGTNSFVVNDWSE